MPSYSYQEIESRLQAAERKLEFIMRNFRMKAFRGNGLVNADGSPQGQFIETDLLGLYHMAQQASEVSSAATEPVATEAAATAAAQQEQING